MKEFGGPVLVLDRDDINTDEIIPAKYLTEITREALKPHLLEDLKLPGFDPRSVERSGARVVLSRKNFGCGSSREHAPWAFEANGVTAAVAEGMSRIFRQNMLNSGMLSVELPPEEIDALVRLAKTGKPEMRFDLERLTLTLSASGGSKTASFRLNDFELALIRAGGWVEYANARY
ncbi:MAG: 3-isopropylmalate dehydratase small subunit [Planctomycetota bacterium]